MSNNLEQIILLTAMVLIWIDASVLVKYFDGLSMVLVALMIVGASVLLEIWLKGRNAWAMTQTAAMIMPIEVSLWTLYRVSPSSIAFIPLIIALVTRSVIIFQNEITAMLEKDFQIQLTRIHAAIEASGQYAPN